MSERLSMQGMQRPGIVPGILVSLALHAVLIFGYRLAAPTPAPELPPNRTMTVWLRPLPLPLPLPLPAPAVHTPAAAAPPIAAAATQRQRQRTPPARDARVATAPIAPQAPVQADRAVLAESTKPADDYDPLRAPEEPKPFDMEAARKAARKVAVEKPAPGTLAAQLQAHPLYPEDDGNKLGKDVARAGRPDCLKGGGNLLTPLFWLLDKKDHGCKL